MKYQFTIKGQVWILSPCLKFVKPSDGGWYAISMFNDAFREIALNSIK